MAVKGLILPQCGGEGSVSSDRIGRRVMRYRREKNKKHEF